MKIEGTVRIYVNFNSQFYKVSNYKFELEIYAQNVRIIKLFEGRRRKHSEYEEEFFLDSIITDNIQRPYKGEIPKLGMCRIYFEFFDAKNNYFLSHSILRHAALNHCHKTILIFINYNWFELRKDNLIKMYLDVPDGTMRI